MAAEEATHGFGRTYWEDHWTRHAPDEHRLMPLNPYLSAETAHLPRGTALDAGCGTGSEAIWLAEAGWQVTGADISSTALATAAERAASAGIATQIEWVEADLTRWQPRRSWDLVVTSYAHADIGQLPLYRLVASWVASGGTVLIVGHLHGSSHNHGAHEHPHGAAASLDAITDLFAAPDWQVEAGYENARVIHAGGHQVRLRDVIVRARRMN